MRPLCTPLSSSCLLSHEGLRVAETAAGHQLELSVCLFVSSGPTVSVAAGPCQSLNRVGECGGIYTYTN